MTSPNGNIFRVTGPLCGEFTGPGEFPTQRPVTRSFDLFFDLRLNKRLSKQPRGWWFGTPSWSLWRQCNGKWALKVNILGISSVDILSTGVAKFVNGGPPLLNLSKLIKVRTASTCRHITNKKMRHISTSFRIYFGPAHGSSPLPNTPFLQFHLYNLLYCLWASTFAEDVLPLLIDYDGMLIKDMFRICNIQ